LSQKERKVAAVYQNVKGAPKQRVWEKTGSHRWGKRGKATLPSKGGAPLQSGKKTLRRWLGGGGKGGQREKKKKKKINNGMEGVSGPDGTIGAKKKNFGRLPNQTDSGGKKKNCPKSGSPDYKKNPTNARKGEVGKTKEESGGRRGVLSLHADYRSFCRLKREREPASPKGGWLDDNVEGGGDENPPKENSLQKKKGAIAALQRGYSPWAKYRKKAVICLAGIEVRQSGSNAEKKRGYRQGQEGKKKAHRRGGRSNIRRDVLMKKKGKRGFLSQRRA